MWSVPVVAVTTSAPAYAVSLCPVVTANWSSLGNGTKITSGSSYTFGGAIVTVTDTGNTTAPNNATVSTAATGGATSSLRFYDANTSSSSQTITFTFDKPVYNLSFTLLDVDSSTNSFYDQVQVGPTGYTYTLGSSVTGTGAAGDLFRATNNNTVVPGTQVAGNVTLNWSASLTAVTITYSQYAGTVSGSPFVGISNLNFQTAGC